MRFLRWALLALLLGAGLWLLLRTNGLQTPPQQKLYPTAERPSGDRADRVPESDLPPPGTRSLFDHHIARLGGEVPYPFEALLDSFARLDRWNQGSVTLLIPEGRSLAKAYTDDAHPRVLAAVQLTPKQDDKELQPLYSGRLFFGLVEKIKAIEIIAYNEAAGRFEFQLVQDYCAGCQPRIQYARRAICTACHQAGDPIFAVRPWSETNANPVIARRIAAAQGIPWPSASKTRYQGVPISTQIVMPETFDQLVNQASRVSLAQRVWQAGCGDDGLQCRRRLLQQALALLLDPGGFHPEAAENRELKALQKECWPENGIPIADHRLPDRKPAELSRWQRWQRTLNQFWSRWNSAPNSPIDSAVRLANLREAAGLTPELDPLSERPPMSHLKSDSLDGVHALSQMLTPQDRSLLLQLSGGEPARLQAAIGSGHLDDVLQPNAPFQRHEILQRLAQALGTEAPRYCCADASKLPEAEAEDSQALAIATASPLKLFERYCFACHRGNPVPHLNFMGGESETAVLDAIRRHPKIRSVLQQRQSDDATQTAPQMPPAASLQRAWLEESDSGGSNDRLQMLKALDDGG